MRLEQVSVTILLCSVVFAGLTGFGGAQTLPASPRVAGPIAYVAIGASDAFGIGTQDPRTESWPAQLAQRLGSGYHLINLGIPGATVDLARRAEVPVALAQAPGLITIWLGINDLDANIPLDTFSQGMRSLLLDLTAQTNATILVGNIPDLTLLPRYAGTDAIALETRIAAWNRVIALICRAAGVVLVDLFASWNDLRTHPDAISADGFHPSVKGAERLGAIFDTARRALPIPTRSAP